MRLIIARGRCFISACIAATYKPSKPVQVIILLMMSAVANAIAIIGVINVLNTSALIPMVRIDNTESNSNKQPTINSALSGFDENEVILIITSCNCLANVYVVLALDNLVTMQAC